MYNILLDIVGVSPLDNPIGFTLSLVFLYSFYQLIIHMLMSFMGYASK